MTVSVSVTVVRFGHCILLHQGPQWVAFVQDLGLSYDWESQFNGDDLLDVRLRVVHHLLTPVVPMSTRGLVRGRPPAPAQVANVLKSKSSSLFSTFQVTPWSFASCSKLTQ